ncbi:MAG: heavy-metal-associated domain-containing protein [Clostridiales bacterium]|nr:heavy-metal-associated domain-containing protein [Clostridiales bacterium]
MNNVHFNVYGLQNTQMKTQLKNVLKGLDGVRNVNVDLGRGSVEVKYNEPTDVKEIRQGIEQIGCKIR